LYIWRFKVKRIIAFLMISVIFLIPSGLANASDNSIPVIPSITVISPNGGENWSVGSIQKITWTSTGVSGKVLIEVSSNGGNYYQWADYAPVPDTGEYEWYVAYDMSNIMKVKVSSVADPSISDESDGLFSLSPNPGTATLLSPNGGETLSIGSQVEIKWQSDLLVDHFVKGGGKVTIILLRGAPYDGEELVTWTNNDGAYMWKVNGPATTQAKVVVAVMQPGNTIWDESDASFTIQ
jgi:hypothetical protein